MNKPVLIFDFGGVLIEWNPYNVYLRYFDGDKRAVERFFKEIDFFGWNYEQDKGRSFARGVAVLSERFPQYAELICAYDTEWENSIGALNQPVKAILERLKLQGYKLLGLTNFSLEKYKLIEDRLDFITYLDHTVISGEVGMAKPDHEIFELALRHAGCVADECIFIDDSLVNVESARQFGMRAIHFQSAEQLWGDLERAGIFE